MTAPAVPASFFVNVTPSVLPAGGQAVETIGLILSNALRVPYGQTYSFPTAATVAAFFGGSSPEAAMANVYFEGFANSAVKPGALLFAQYNWLGREPAYLRGASLVSLGLTALKALAPGTIIVTIDGNTFTSSSINLSGATSFSNAASLIQTGLAANDASFTGVIAGTNLTTSSVTGTIGLYQIVTGAGVTAGTSIISQTSGTVGGAGVYVINNSQAVSSEAMTSGSAQVTYDSIGGGFQITSGTTGATSSITFATGTLSTALALTQAAGAVIGNGSTQDSPNAFMTALTDHTQNWATFTTAFEPTVADKEAFAAWCSAQNGRFAYGLWTTEVAVSQQNDTTSSVAICYANEYQGFVPMYAPVNGNLTAAFQAGWGASLDWGQTRGRQNLTFSASTGLAPDVTSEATLANLVANGCGAYVAAGLANNQNQNFFYEGFVGGPFLWADSYYGQIHLNSALTAALLNLLTAIGSIPYTPLGYGLVKAAMAGPINDALNYGTINAGVALTALQAADVNAKAGANIAPVIQNTGYYLLVQDPGGVVRQARGSPIITLFYADGQSIQSIDVSSVDVQ